MYNVSDLFKTYSKQFDRTIEAKVDIQGTTYLGSDIIEFNIEDSVASTEDFTIGTTISSILNMSIRTTDTIPAGAQITPYVRLNGTSGVSEWLKLGDYYVDSRVMQDKVWGFTCYDKLIFGQAEYLSSLSYPATMQQVWNEVCSKLGVTSDSSVVINPTYKFDVAPTGHTMREVLGFIAAAHVASVRMTKDGTIGWVKFSASASSVEKITASDYSKAPQTNPAKSFTRIVVQSGSDSESTQIEVGTGTEDKTLTLINPYISQSMLNDMYKVFNGFRYIPFTMDWRCFPYIEVGDRIEAEMFNALSWVEASMPWSEANFPWKDLPTFSTVICKNKITYTGGLKATSSASSTSSQQSELKFKGTITEQLNTLDKVALREGKPYYGVTFSREYGFKVDSSLGSSVTLNGDTIALGSSSDEGIYFDVLTGKYRINGTLEAVDGKFDGTVFAENIDTSNAKISVAQIEELEVGTNVFMGSNAYLSWNKITDQPYIPQTAAELGAMTQAQLYTTLGQDFVLTGKIFSQQIYGDIAHLASGVYIGDINSNTSKSLEFLNTGSAWDRLQLYYHPSYYANVFELSSDSILSLQGGSSDIWIDDNGIQLNGDVEAYKASFYGLISFFGAEPIGQQSAQLLPSTATLANVITKLNGIMNQLANTGLIYVYS